ncbi:F-box/kelch-repeat protein [Striga hermonthica]|uniref:F-box/kelch-repeat protein n=1 Tax=Striga hermonthica TaxID=68872 RepID=A0A9N7MNZ2_STRHE|nr:F-box/kelch-repeat protein [Striga hermonthica]
MSEYLPQEMLIKILTRLPPKTLIKFRCVSKTWNSLISSPYFISAHTQRQILFSKPQAILRRYLRPLQTELYSLHREFDCEDLKEQGTEIEYPFRNLTRFYFRIVGSCNGVLCLSDDLFGRPGPILLWNPSIKRKLVLPDSDNAGDQPYSHVRVLGFGYDPMHDDYKVVRLSYVQGDNGYPVPPEAEVFALSTKSWCKINPGRVPEKCVVEYFWSQVVINANVHWVAYKDSGRHAKEDVSRVAVIVRVKMSVSLLRMLRRVSFGCSVACLSI